MMENPSEMLEATRDAQASLRGEVIEARRKMAELDAIEARLTAAEDGVQEDLEECRNLWAEVASLEADLQDEIVEIERLHGDLVELCRDAERLQSEMDAIAGEAESLVATADAAAAAATENEVAAQHAAMQAGAHAADAAHHRTRTAFDPKYDTEET